MNRTFSYRAVGDDGKTRRGEVSARDEADAFAKLRLEQLSPLELKPTSSPSEASFASRQASLIKLQKNDRLSDQDIEDLLGRLAVLLRAGTDIRSALQILGDEASPVKAMSTRILSGATVEAALSPVFGSKDSHLAAVIAAGEVRGDLPSGLEAAAKILATRRQIRQQLFEALSYPIFVFIAAMAALLVILLVVVPAIAPLLDDSQQTMPVFFQMIVGLSEILQLWGLHIIALLVLIVVIFGLANRYGGLKRHVEVWMLDGPLGSLVRPIIFGGYAQTLGEMLGRGAGLSEALRLCQRSLSSEVARSRTEVIISAVRQGRLLSEGLTQVKGFPRAVIRLCEVGEASGSMGPMLSRAGQREEELALKNIEKVSKVLGPGLIIILGAVIGLIMGGVLTGVDGYRCRERGIEFTYSNRPSASLGGTPEW